MTPEEAIKDLELEGGIEITGRPRRLAKFLEALDVAAEALKEIQQYREIGTVEECREARENRKAMKARFYAHNFYCPECGEIVGNNEFNWTNNFCRNCGQAILWENLEEMEDDKTGGL